MLIGQDRVEPAGLGARDTLRLEMGYPLYGHELDRDTTPLEAGFGKFLGVDHEFIGNGGIWSAPKKSLAGIRFSGRRAAREECDIFNDGGRRIGTVTSGSFSPSLQHAIALSYLEPDELEIKNRVTVRVGSRTIEGRITGLPFYLNGTARD